MDSHDRDESSNNVSNITSDISTANSLQENNAKQTTQQESGAATGTEKEERLVPVTEAIRYRKRAQVAERTVIEMRNDLEKLEQDLSESQDLVDYLERRQKIDSLLSESDAIDMQAARLLTEMAIEQMEDPDVRLAVDDLRESKPYLFRKRGPGHALAMPVRDQLDQGDELYGAAEAAASSGARTDLLRYLKLRRNQQVLP
ncbi:hypothetical protein [Poriferisphaera sp. WC338]|uniref:hypothetical protein n=1 Tax=Poriferisphaera sp. WC338 TaxID=3425129 RepID=UPI003D812FEC